MTAFSKFHCIILKVASPLWIGETFNLCGFQKFFFQIPTIVAIQNAFPKRWKSFLLGISATSTAKTGFYDILSNVNCFSDWKRLMGPGKMKRRPFPRTSRCVLPIETAKSISHADLQKNFSRKLTPSWNLETALL